MKKITFFLSTLMAFAAIVLLMTISGTPDDPPAEQAPQTMHKSGLIEGYTYEDLLEKSPVIVLGRVAEQADPVQIMAAGNGGVSNFTDYTVEVLDGLRGGFSSGDELTVRVEGGEANGLNVVVEEAPELHEDDVFLMFLYAPEMGGGYNTQGDYYYVVGVNQGLFENAENVSASEAEEGATLVNPTDISLTLPSLKADLSARSGQVTASAGSYEEFLENQQKNLESGFITQEEYDRLLEEVGQYATIVE